jgi:hypothetical protein
MPEYASHRIGKDHFYAYLRRPPASWPTHEFEDGTLVPFGWSEYLVEIGPTNSRYLHVDMNSSDEPIGVEILDANDKLTAGWRDNVRVDLDRQEVTFGDNRRIVTATTATYENLRAQLGYDEQKKLVSMRFRQIALGDPANDPDRFVDPEFEAFLA